MNCLACDCEALTHWTRAEDREYLTSDKKWDYLQCPSCGALSISPVPRDQLNIIYPKIYYSFQPRRPSFISRLKETFDRKLFRRILSTIPGAQLNVLDVGGGAGHILTVVRSADKRIAQSTIVDLDSDAGKEAIRHGHQFFHGPIQNFQTDQKFDFILLLNLIEHVERPEDLLIAAKKLLNPGGKILLQTPNFESLDEVLFRKHSWAGYHCPRHWVLFHRASLDQLIKKCELRTESFSYTQGAPFWAASFVDFFSRLGLTKLSADRPAYRNPFFPFFLLFFAGFDFLRLKMGFKTSQMVYVLSL